MKSLIESGFNNIKIKALGYGPMLASFSLLRGFLKYIPVIYQLLLNVSYNQLSFLPVNVPLVHKMSMISLQYTTFQCLGEVGLDLISIK